MSSLPDIWILKEVLRSYPLSGVQKSGQHEILFRDWNKKS